MCVERKGGNGRTNSFRHRDDVGGWAVSLEGRARICYKMPATDFALVCYLILGFQFRRLLLFL